MTRHERRFRAHYPNAIIQMVTPRSCRSYYVVRTRPRAHHPGMGFTPSEAWSEACKLHIPLAAIVAGKPPLVITAVTADGVTRRVSERRGGK